MQNINRNPWPITPDEIGFGRALYFSLISSFIVYSIFLFLCVFISNLGLNYIDFNKRLVVLIWVMAIPLIIVTIIKFFFREANVSWLEIRNIGDKRLLKYDLFNMLLCIVLSICSAIIRPAFISDYTMLAGLIIVSFILNATTHKDTNWKQKEDNGHNRYEDKDKDKDKGNNDNDDSPNPDNQELIFQNYEWTSEIGRFFINDFCIRKSDYQAAYNLNANGPKEGYCPEDYLTRVQYDPDKTVSELAFKIESTHIDKSLIAQIDNVLQFIHEPNFKYQFDEVAHPDFKEYGRYPIETMVERVGDCECLSILLCSLMKYCGFNTALILLKNPAHAMGGIAIPFDLPGKWVIGKSGKKYMMCEATGVGWKIGNYSWEAMELWDVLEI
jgi:hypothetical protein